MEQDGISWKDDQHPEADRLEYSEIVKSWYIYINTVLRSQILNGVGIVHILKKKKND